MHRAHEFPPDLPRLVDERQAARLLAVSVGLLRKWRRQSCGPAFTRCGRCVRYNVDAIQNFLAENTSTPQKATDSQSAAKQEVRSEHAAAQR